MMPAIMSHVAHMTFGQKIWHQVRDYGSSYNLLVVGAPGSGKSFVSCLLLQLLDPKYNPWEDIAFTEAEYKKIVAQKRPIGRATQWEEAGTIESAHARNFGKESNKETSTLFQIMRHNRGINVVNVPLGSMVDRHIRYTAHARVIVEGHTEHYAYGRVLLNSFSYQDDSEKVYPKYLRYFSKSGEYFKLTRFIALKPRKDIVKIYEQRAEEFKKRLEETLAERAEERLDKESGAKKELERMQELVKRGLDLAYAGKLKQDKNGFNSSAIAYYLGIENKEARRVKPVLDIEYEAGGDGS